MAGAREAANAGQSGTARIRVAAEQCPAGVVTCDLGKWDYED
jgi:hypothetical protein